MLPLKYIENYINNPKFNLYFIESNHLYTSYYHGNVSQR